MFNLFYTAHPSKWVWYISCVVLLILYMLWVCCVYTCTYTLRNVYYILRNMCYMLRSVRMHARYILRGIYPRADYMWRCIITSYVMTVSHLFIAIFAALVFLFIVSLEECRRYEI